MLLSVDDDDDDVCVCVGDGCLFVVCCDSSFWESR